AREAEAGATAQVRLRVTGDPVLRQSRTVAPGGRSTFVLVPVRAERLRVGHRSWRVHQALLLIASGADASWLTLLPSQRAEVDGRLAPARPADTVTAVIYVTEPPRSVRGPSEIQHVAGTIRQGLRRCAAVLPRRERGLLPGLVVGDTTRLDQDVQDDFRAAGLTHLVAVSGANCAVVMGVALALARRTRLGLRSRAVWSGTLLLGFVVLARPSGSVLRAALMGMFGAVAMGAGRPRATVPILSGSVLVLILTDPMLGRSIGFSLSVLATAGLVILAPGWRDSLAGWLPSRLAEAVAVPLAAQAACAPLIASFAGTVSTVAVLANLVALPAVPPATVAGVLAALIAPVSPPLAQVMTRVAGVPCWWLVTVAHASASLPHAQLGWPAGRVGALALIILTVVGAAAVRRRRGRRALLAACVGFTAMHALVIPRLPGGWPPPGWRMAMCDVGQGDALVLSAGGDTGVLVDAGPDPAPLRACLRSLGIRRLALIVLTHLHADHVEGLPAVLGHLPVPRIEIGPLLEPPAEWARVRRWAGAARVPITQARAGEYVRLGTLSWRVIAPTTVLHGTDSDPNNNSIAMRVQTPDMSLLLLGDAEIEEQSQLLGRSDTRVDVLKVAHHGSARQDPALLAATGARVALISVGAGNSYGHPAPRTVHALSSLGMSVFRTDLDGSLAVSRVAGAITVTRRARSGALAGARAAVPDRLTHPVGQATGSVAATIGAADEFLAGPGTWLNRRPHRFRDRSAPVVITRPVRAAARSPPPTALVDVTCSGP
ncbi:MAG: ComEC/Rec2 family competence protein, partial [Frankia sp.]